MVLIECKRINRYFGEGNNRVHILKNIDLSIEKGDFVAIIGQSGSGKSTLMNILGLLDTPCSGSYAVGGEPTQTMSANQLAALRRQRFGFIFQRYNLLSALSARDNVALPAVYTGMPPQQRRQRADSLLAKLGLQGKEQNKPSALSGGQQQRVSIARALMNGGEIIFADEPTGALDSASGENVMNIIRNLNADGHTVIMVTHDPNIAAQTKRIIEIKDGEIVSDCRHAPLQHAPDVPVQTENRGRHFYYGQFTEALRMSVQAVAAHKMRSLLTMLGIIIGIAAVVSVIALGRGTQEKILSDISAMGTNTIGIYPGKGFGDRHARRIKTLTVADSDAIRAQSYVESSTPMVSNSGSLTFRNTTLAANLYGAGGQYFDVRGIKLQHGRLFDDDDVKNNAQVAVIDPNTVKKLFPEGSNPIGQTVLFKMRPLTVIGITQAQQSPMGNSDSLQLWAPYTTVMNRISGDKHINNITVKIKDNVNAQIAEKSLTELLTVRHGTQDFFTNNSDSIKQTIVSTTGTMTLLISGIAVISLIVGGIGVMNIMLVSVVERTKEIGVRMAIGARQSNILQQFLIESMLLCLLGGLSGIVLSLTLAALFNSIVQDFSMSFSGASIIGAVLCSSIIGMVFGFIPARNASKLNPIDALAHD